MGLGRAGSERAIALAVLVAACGFALPASAQPAGNATADAAQNRAWCENRERTFAPDLRIKSCTALIDSNDLTRHDLAISHNNRGAAYQDKRDVERAIADYDEAIKLNPTYAPAYNNRVYVHQLKRHPDAALAHYTNAIRFD